MRKGWKIYPFEDCLESVPKTTKIPSADYKKEGAYPIVSQEELLVSGYWDDEQALLSITHPVIVFGDHTRVLKYIDFDFVIGADGVKVLSPKVFLSPKFLFYYLKWFNVPSLGYSRHYKLLKEMSVPVPPLTEQERIVAELDLLQGIIDKQKAQLKELDTLAQSIFYDMFGDPVENERGWTVYQLFELVTEDCPISYGIVQPGDGEKIGVPVVRPVDLTTTFVHNNGLKLTTEAISNAYKRTILKGDELLLCVRGTTGIVSLAAEDLIGCNVSRGITPLRFKTANRFFMLYQFKTPMIQRIVSELTHGIALKGMNMSDVRKMRFICPPSSLQDLFGIKIESIERQKASINASIAETQKLFDYTMDKYFG